MDRLKHACLSGARGVLEYVLRRLSQHRRRRSRSSFRVTIQGELRYVLRIYFPASNNAAEYEACLHGLRIAVELGVKRLYVYEDSALVINQLNKD